MSTTPTADQTTKKPTVEELQARIAGLEVTVEGLLKNISILDGNLQKIYSAFNSLVKNNK